MDLTNPKVAMQFVQSAIAAHERRLSGATSDETRTASATKLSGDILSVVANYLGSNHSVSHLEGWVNEQEYAVQRAHARAAMRDLLRGNPKFLAVAKQMRGEDMAEVFNELVKQP